MDGYEFITRLRHNENQSKETSPVIAITSNAIKGEKEKCLDAGFDDYCTKPIKIAELKALLEKWLEI